MSSEPQHSGQKRRREDDGYDDRRPRVTTTRQILLRLRREIVEIGEPSRFKVSQMVHHLGDGLGNIDLDEVRTGVLDTIVAVVKEQPHKIPLIAGAIQVANFKTEIIGQSTVEMVHSKIEESIDAAQWTWVKVFVRFLVCLSPIVDGDGVINLLRTLMERAVALSKGDKRSGAAEEVYVGVLLALPFYVKTGERDRVVDEKLVEQAESVLTIAEQFDFKSDDEQLQIVSPFTSSNEGEIPYTPQQFVKLVKAGVEKVKSELWTASSLLNVGSMVRLHPRAEEFVESQKRHTFPAVNIPEVLKNEPTVFYSYPRLFFQAYLPKVFETVPRPGTFEAVIIRDVATDIINGMDFNRKEVARQLITLDLFFAPPTFAPPGISFDKLESVEPGKSTWKVEDVALEAVLDHIFLLPKTHHKPAYYDSILIEACIMAPQAIAPVFGRAIRFLYSSLEVLDVELFNAYLDWFSHHLSNFGFTWKWAEWEKDTELETLHPKKLFIKELIGKEVRLCYVDRIKETLPEKFIELLPATQDEEAQFKYIDESESVYNEVVNKLVAQFREGGAKRPQTQKPKKEDAEMKDAEKETNEEEDGEGEGENGEDEKKSGVDEALNELREKVTSESVGGQADAVEKTIVDAVVTCVCYLGSRSLSHAENWVERCSPVLHKVVAPELEQDVILAVMNAYKQQPHVGLASLQFFIRNSIITQWSLLQYIISDTALLFSSHGWNTIVRMVESRDTPEDSKRDLVAKLIAKIIEDGKDKQGWENWWYTNTVRAFARRFHQFLPDTLDDNAAVSAARSLNPN